MMAYRSFLLLLLFSPSIAFGMSQSEIKWLQGQLSLQAALYDQLMDIVFQKHSAWKKNKKGECVATSIDIAKHSIYLVRKNDEWHLYAEKTDATKGEATFDGLIGTITYSSCAW